MEEYPHIAKAAIALLTRFATSYLYEQGFSKYVVEIKTKKRSRLDCDCDNNMRVGKFPKRSHAFPRLLP